MNDCSQKQLDEFVENVMRLSAEHSTKAADLATAGATDATRLQSGALDEHAIKSFHMAYKDAHADSYTSGAIEAMRALRGEERGIDWMADFHQETMARKWLGDEWLMLRCKPYVNGDEAACSEEGCPSYDGKRCELEGFPCRQCDPWIERFGPALAPR